MLAMTKVIMTATQIRIIILYVGAAIEFLDIETEYDFNIDRIAENHFNGDIEYHTLLFYGTCNECLSENN